MIKTTRSFIALIIFALLPITIDCQTYNQKYSDAVEEINEYLQVNEFSDALPMLQKLEKDGYTNANIYYKLGQCYLNSVFDRSRSIPYLEKAAKETITNYNYDNTLETKAPIKAFLYLGDAYRVNNRLNDAKKTYKKYLLLVKGDNKEQAIAEKRIFECQMAQVFMKHPSNVQFHKLNNAINSGLGNFNVCISGDGKSLVFNRKMKFYDAIFYCTRAEGDWSEPKEITTNVGSDGEFRPTGLSPDGKRMLLTSFNQFTGYDIYESIFRDGRWRKMKILNNNVNSAFYDIDAVYGADGKEIYFSSNRTVGYGGFDLYKVSIDDAGNLGIAKNLGSTINSDWDEKSPTLFDDGKTLIFSSQRKPGMGGYDFFYSKIDENGKWGQVYNAGYPLSTVGNDMGLSTKLIGKEGVLAKYEPGSNADAEIFNVQFDALSRFKIVSINGEVKMKTSVDSTFKGLTLCFIDETIKDTIGTVKDPEDGKYKMDLYPGDFKVVMAKENIGTVSQNFTIPMDESKTDFALLSEFNPEIKKSLNVPKIAIFDTIYVTDILFDFDKSIISEKEKENLKKLIGQLKKHTITKIELIGYTDYLGKKAYNLNLSAMRASNAMAFLITNGISKDIITAKGMGDAVMIAKNKDAKGADIPEGRALNRRVEIHIISSDSNLIINRKDLVPLYLKP